MRLRILSLIAAALTTQLQAGALLGGAGGIPVPSPAILFGWLGGARAGGPTNVIARSLSQQMEDSLGQPVMVENRGGAAGTLAAGIVVTYAEAGLPGMEASA